MITKYECEHCEDYEAESLDDIEAHEESCAVITRLYKAHNNIDDLIAHEFDFKDLKEITEELRVALRMCGKLKSIKERESYASNNK